LKFVVSRRKSEWSSWLQVTNTFHKAWFLLFLINNLHIRIRLMLLLELLIMHYLLILNTVPSGCYCWLIIYRRTLLFEKCVVVIFFISMTERYWRICSKTVVFYCFLIFNNVWWWVQQIISKGWVKISIFIYFSFKCFVQGVFTLVCIHH